MKRYFLIIAAIALMACAKSKDGAQDKTPSTEDGLMVKDSITIVSYNIHHGAPSGNTAPINLDNIEAVIRDLKPDLVALQEVDKNTLRSVVDQAKVLGDKLGMSYFFSKSINYQSGEYGVAILSKFPIVGSERILMTTGGGGEQRSLAIVTVDIPKLGYFKLASAHLDLVLGNRQLQVQQLNEYSRKSNYPFILAGDLNMERNDSEFMPLKNEFVLSCLSGCPLTFPAENPSKEIDFILMSNAAAKKLTVGRYKAKASLASDHLPLTGVFTFMRKK